VSQVNHLNGPIESLFQQLRFEDFVRAAMRDQSSVGKQNHTVGETGSDVQVMGYRHNRNGLCDSVLPYELHEAGFVPQIQVSRRLVEQEKTWLLHQRPGKASPLQLAARQLAHITIRQFAEINRTEASFHSRVIVCAE
jgi:hypothetical protein